MAEYLREKVEAYHFQIKQPVTSSFGVAEIHQEDIHSFNALLLRADQALYQAKSTGRNKVVAS